MGVKLTKLFNDAINQGSLRETDGSRGSVANDSDAKGIFHRTEVRDFPVFTKLSLKARVFVHGGRDRDDVIDMYGENGDTSRSLASVHTPLTSKTVEAERGHNLVKGLVPDAGCLFHAV